MKRITIFVFAALISVAAFAQPVPVQQQASRPDACNPVNATAAVNAQATLTLTPPSGQFVYLCGWDITVSQDATSTVNTNLTFTSTNLGGWLYKYSLPATANTSLTQSFYFNVPVLSAASGVGRYDRLAGRNASHGILHKRVCLLCPVNRKRGRTL